MTARSAKAGPFAAARSSAQLLVGGISRHAFTTRQPIPVIRHRDEVLAATRRYNVMTESDRVLALPARAWDAIADRLRAAARLVSGDKAEFVLARSRDAHHRAEFADRTGAVS